jgi:glycosyltransferase involved in cell wall biosynthesis
MNNNSVSIIIPCYNGERYIAEAVMSALSQSASAQVIVVDDGSTDNSRSILEQYSNQIVLVCKENGGVSSARNKGIAHSESDYIVFLDADDVLTPHCIEDHLKVAIENPEVGLIYGSNYIIDENGQQIGINPQSATFRTIQQVAEGQIPAPSQSMYLRKAVLEAGCFDQTIAFGEDMDLILRIGVRYKIASHEQFVVSYRHHPGQATKKPSAAFKGMMGIIEKYSESDQYNEISRNIDWKQARKHWKRYFGQFIPIEIAKNFVNGDIYEVPKKVLIYIRTFPQGLYGTLSFIAYRLKSKND